YSDKYGEAISPLQSPGLGCAGTFVRATDAPLRNGLDHEAAAQGGQHQAALRIALYGDRPVACPRLHICSWGRAGWPPPRAYRVRDHRGRPSRITRLDG